MAQLEGSEQISRKDQDVPSAHNRLLDEFLSLTKGRPVGVLSNGSGGTPDEIRRAPFSPDADKAVQCMNSVLYPRPVIMLDHSDIYLRVPTRPQPAEIRPSINPFGRTILKPIEEPKK